MVAEVFAGIGAIKSAFEIAKGLKDIDDATRRNAAVIELQEKILAAQAAQASLVERVGELEKEVARLEAWNAEQENYELTSVGDRVFAYSKKAGMGGTEPSHYLCANCFAERHKAILQKEITEIGRWTVFVCSRCGAEIYPDGGGRQSTQRSRSSSIVRRR
jgi:hypothetical protein